MTHITDQVRLLLQPTWSLLNRFMRTTRWQEQQLCKGSTAQTETDLTATAVESPSACLPPTGTTSWQTTPSPLLHRNGDGWSSLQETLILYWPLPASLCKIKLAYCPAGYKMGSETLTSTGCHPSLNTLMWEPNDDSGVMSFLISNFASCLMNYGIC